MIKSGCLSTIALILKSFALVIILSISQSAGAQLDGTYEVVIKKQQEKKNSRWSLAEWMDQKNKNRLMDLWLAQNSHTSLYEFYLEANSISIVKSNSLNQNSSVNDSQNALLAAYAGRIGLAAGYLNEKEDRTRWSGSFNIRLIGRAVQDTHVNLYYGLMGQTNLTQGQSSDYYQNQFAGADLSLYITKNFGVEGKHAKILSAKSSSGNTLEGEISSAGVFIDFGFLRAFGVWKKELQMYDGGSLPQSTQSTQSTQIREGIGGGIKFFF